MSLLHVHISVDDASQPLRRLGDALVRPPFHDRQLTRLTAAHGVDAAASALLGLSLVDSLFFHVSLDASRSRIALSLLLTMGPLVRAWGFGAGAVEERAAPASAAW